MMKINKKIIKDGHRTITTNTMEFNSINEFVTYINITPDNSIFKGRVLKSKIKDSFRTKFTQTKSFEEASDLLKYGWDTMAKKLETELKLISGQIGPSIIKRSNFDVVGFQASVPRYLQGIPTNMVNQKKIVQKQKVITLNKDISYPAIVNAETIVEESVKALQIIKSIEAQGVRCNLNLIYGAEVEEGKITERNILKIRLKNANERLNLSKLAFPLVHPSMLRRLFFRFTEVCPRYTLKEFVYGYGIPVDVEYLEIPGEYLLEKFIRDPETFIKKFA